MSDDLQPRDPLRGVPDQQRELFNRLTRVCEGFTARDVMGAAGNIILNAMRQQYRTRDKAEIAFNEIFGVLKQLLMNHYGPTQQRKDGIFPFDQTVEVPHFDFRDQSIIMGKRQEQKK